MNSRPMLARPFLAVFLLATACRLPAGNGGEGERGKFRLEVSAGGQALDPSGLNRAAESDERLEFQQYDHYLEYLRASGRVESWSESSAGGRARVRAGWLLESRLLYGLGRSLFLSAGLRFLQGERSQGLFREYTREFAGGDSYVETLSYTPYRLAVSGWWPSVGIHLRRRLGSRLHAEGHAAAGPLFAGASYRSTWSYAWDMRGSGYSWPVFRDAGGREEKGSGTGYGLELGARIGMHAGRRLSFFAAAAHSWQRVGALRGSGSETRAGGTDSWSGRWVMRGETITAPWETIALSYPTCRPQDGAADGPFRLDLSGWLLRCGLSWRL